MGVRVDLEGRTVSASVRDLCTPRRDRGAGFGLLQSLRARLGQQVHVDHQRDRADELDGVILQDYGKGLLVAAVIDELMAIFDQHLVRVFVDPKQLPWDRYKGAELVKPNLREAQEVTQVRISGSAELERVGREVLEMSGAQTVAITRGAEGMAVFPRDEKTLDVPTVQRAVADQAGAGDTAIATLALARLAGASWLEAAELANAAAGVVVGIPGTATVAPADLLRAIGTER